jgi:hypothetical protein
MDAIDTISSSLEVPPSLIDCVGNQIDSAYNILDSTVSAQVDRFGRHNCVASENRSMIMHAITDRLSQSSDSRNLFTP